MSALLPAIVIVLAAIQAADVETIVRANMSNVDQARTVVARTDAEWAALWKTHNDARPAPKVDLTRRMVVAVFLGSRPSAGYSVEVVGTRQDGKTLVVQWREYPPKPGNLSAQVLTSPAHLVSVAKFAGEVRFEKAAE